MLWSLCDLHDVASEEFIEAVRSQYPFVDEEYLNFLRYTDGCRINIWYFFGSGSPHYIPDHIFSPQALKCPGLFDEAKSLNTDLSQWRDVSQIGDFIPVGGIRGGEEYLLMLSDGSILSIDCEFKKTEYDVMV